MKNYLDKVRRYAPITPSEYKAILITIIITTFIVAFNDKSEAFSVSGWSSNFIVWLLIVTSAILVRQLGYRLVGVFYNYRVEYQIWWYGLLFGLMLSFVTMGHIWLIIPGGFTAHVLKFHRVGWFRYGMNLRALSFIGLGGAFANILFGTFVKTLQIWFHVFPADSILVQNIFFFNMWFAALSLLPIPPLDGSKVLFDSRLIYAFLFGGVFTYAILAYYQIYSYLFAILGAFVVWGLYFLFGESKL